ncbi:MAG: hypothetical protein OEZ01_07330 [Candidatus Heimdallarchaeota archaeon]|nr:hypothetical protein [Candidatus Heimdallarchaeota archaeon]MDH5645802.1 hypothetical protein [Candidatus Heimdallarchaeota archaeon]
MQARPHIPFNGEELKEMLHSDSKNERVAACRRIWTDWPYLEKKESLYDQGALIHQFLINETEETRDMWHYLLSLGTLNYLPAIPNILEKLQFAKTIDVRGMAADALGRYSTLEDQTRSLLWKMLEPEHPIVVRVNSIRAIFSEFKGSKNDERAIELFNYLKKADNDAIKFTGMSLLGEIGSTIIVPDLTHIMITRRTELDKKISADTLTQIAKMNGFETRDDLIKKIGSSGKLEE